MHRISQFFFSAWKTETATGTLHFFVFVSRQCMLLYPSRRQLACLL
jgi:hypothetical protein